MLNQKAKLELRKNLIEYLENEGYPDYDVLGVIAEGVLLQHLENGVHVVLKPIVKKDDFDPDEALAEYEEKLKAKEEREKKKKA